MFPAELTWTEYTHHVPLCVHAFWNTAAIGRGAFHSASTLRPCSPPIGRSRVRDVERCIIRRVHSSSGARLDCRIHVSRRDTAAADLDFFMCFSSSSLGFHRNSWQVHVWVGREREQSWWGLGNHALWPLNVQKKEGRVNQQKQASERKTHFRFYTDIPVKLCRTFYQEMEIDSACVLF